VSKFYFKEACAHTRVWDQVSSVKERTLSDRPQNGGSRLPWGREDRQPPFKDILSLFLPIF
jgi:hypothetical protein